MLMATTMAASGIGFLEFRVLCSDSKAKGGFGSERSGGNKKKNRGTSSMEEKGFALQQRKTTSKPSGPLTTQAPGLSSHFDGRSSGNTVDIAFEERLEAVRRSALEQKRVEEIKEFGPIDYDAPVESEKKTMGLGAKIGVGVSVLVFGLVFALGDFLPSGSDSPNEGATVVNKMLSDEDKKTLQARLKQYEAALTISPKDTTALEGAAVTLAELGEYTQAVSLLQELSKSCRKSPVTLMSSVCLEKLNMNLKIMKVVLLHIGVLKSSSKILILKFYGV